MFELKQKVAYICVPFGQEWPQGEVIGIYEERFDPAECMGEGSITVYVVRFDDGTTEVCYANELRLPGESL